jgi:hypothetical protein
MAGMPSRRSFPARLGNQLLPHRQGPERAVLQGGPQVVQEPGHAHCLLDPGGGDAVHAGGVRALVARDPGERHDQRRRVMHEVEQVIKPAARVSRRPTVKLGLHPRYPRPRPFRGRAGSAVIRRRTLRHCSLLPFSQPLPPFPVCRAFPGSEYYGGSAPPGPVSGRRACPGQQAGCPPPGAATRRFPCSLLLARQVRSPALPQRHRHGYAAGLPRGLPARPMKTPPEVPAAGRSPRRCAPRPAHIRQVPGRCLD